MTPQFRFTMFHSTVSPGGTVVVQPLGWKEASISLTRDPKFHSLVEYFKGNFVWYGSARQFIRDVEDIGPEEKLRILIELYFSSWETMFDGIIDVVSLEDISKKETFYKLSAPIIRNDFWAKFINRISTPVDLQATVDLDGDARTAVNKITLPLPCQLITLRFLGQLQDIASFGTWSHYYTLLTTEFGSIDWTVIYRNEVKEKHSVKLEDLTARPSELFTIEEDGDYVIESEITIASAAALPSSRVNDVEVYIQVNNDTPIIFTKTQLGTDPADGRTKFEYSDTLTLVKGDTLKFYFENTSGGTRNFYWTNGYYSFLTIEVTTSYIDTQTDAYLLKDAVESVLSKITGNDGVLVSNLFDSCQGLNAIARGKHIRGLSFTDKAFTTSFNELWNGLEPMLNAGLGYTENANEIEIEIKDEFYNASPVVFIPNVSNLIRKHDPSKYVKNIDVGYIKWSAESDNGIDSPQTVRKYRTKFSTIGQDLPIKSSFYASDLGIEQVRRDIIQLGKDNKLDEDICVINVKSDGGSGYEPVLGTDFNAVTNLLNSDTRYNIRHACARIFKRWQKFLQGCLAHTTGEYFYFAGGEGNYEMTSQLEVADCEATDDPEPVLAEDQDIAVDETDFDFIPQLYTAKVPMSKSTYDTILANRKKALGISQTTTNYLPMHILDLDYKIFGGYAELQLLLANNTPLNPTDEEVILQEDGNMILMEDGTSGILIE